MKLSFSIRVRNISPVSQLPQFLNPLQSFTVIIKSSFKYFRFYMVHQVATRKAKSHVLKEKENRIEILSNVLKFYITIWNHGCVLVFAALSVVIFNMIFPFKNKLKTAQIHIPISYLARKGLKVDEKTLNNFIIIAFNRFSSIFILIWEDAAVFPCFSHLNSIVIRSLKWHWIFHLFWFQAVTFSLTS